MKTFPHPLFFALIGALCAPLASFADDDSLPGDGFTVSHYEILWTKSPFAIASSDAVVSDSPDYALVGIAQIDGVSYASLIDKKSNEHFILFGDKAARGLTLVSITNGKNADGTSAVVRRNGESITLKLNTSASSSPAPLPEMPSTLNPIASPSSTPPAYHPPVRFRPRSVHVPPFPGQGQPGAPR